MCVLFRNCAVAAAVNCLLFLSLGSQTNSFLDPSLKTPDGKSQKSQGKKANKELSEDQRDWLENDVPDIITPAERSAYLELGTNEERDQFREHFWELRNPDPELGENSFKEEHYRRIAYANEHFSSGIPGRKTDRGHIYMLWGPPDEIETHPAGGT